MAKEKKKKKIKTKYVSKGERPNVSPSTLRAMRKHKPIAEVFKALEQSLEFKRSVLKAPTGDKYLKKKFKQERIAQKLMFEYNLSRARAFQIIKTGKLDEYKKVA